MKATGIVRRIDDLGRVVIPKEIRRTMRIREGDPLQMTLTKHQFFVLGMLNLSKRLGYYLYISTGNSSDTVGISEGIFLTI